MLGLYMQDAMKQIIRGRLINKMVEAGDLIRKSDDFFEDMGGHILHESNLDEYIKSFLSNLRDDERKQLLEEVSGFEVAKKYVMIDQHIMDRMLVGFPGRLLLSELKQILPEVAIYRGRPNCHFASGVYRVEENGTLTQIETDWDTSD